MNTFSAAIRKITKVLFIAILLVLGISFSSKLSGVHAATGDILRVINPPFSGNGRAIAFDPTTDHLFYTNYRNRHIYVINTSGGLVSILSPVVNGSLIQYASLAWQQTDSGGILWGGRYDGSGYVDKIDPNTGTVTPVFQFHFPSGVGCFNQPTGFIDGLAVDDSDNTLWLGDDATHTLYHVGMDGTNMSGSLNVPGGNCRSGIAVEDHSLWIAMQAGPDQAPFSVGLVSKTDTSNLQQSISITAGISAEGIALDKATFPGQCALWTNQAGGSTVLTAREVPCSIPNPGSPPDTPLNISVVPGNGNATVSYQPPSNTGSSPISGYLIQAQPIYNDRLPAPTAPFVAMTVPPTTLSQNISGLLEDCHERYTISVFAENSVGISSPAVTNGFRPSGNVIQGKDPPYVVVLLDGVNESQPGFQFDPYQPTLDGVPSYCPESWNDATQSENEADIAGSGNGPWSFFHKWNWGEVDDQGNGQPAKQNPDGSSPNSESTPRSRYADPSIGPAGTPTHSFMLDAIAAQGSIILPFSYNGAFLGQFTLGGDPTFSFTKYLGSDSTPGTGPTVQQDSQTLDNEITSILSIWKTSKLVVMGHSQGGLIAFTWWLCSNAHGPYCQGIQTTNQPNLVNAFSLDSPINGACASSACVGPPSYPPYQIRRAFDPKLLDIEASSNNQFRMVGTFGDSPGISIGPVLFGGYGVGAETLEHQLLFNYSNKLKPDDVESKCTSTDESNCPITAPPDHISECPVDQTQPWETAHYVEKYCTGDIKYFNDTLNLIY